MTRRSSEPVATPNTEAPAAAPLDPSKVPLSHIVRGLTGPQAVGIVVSIVGVLGGATAVGYWAALHLPPSSAVPPAPSTEVPMVPATVYVRAEDQHAELDLQFYDDVTRDPTVERKDNVGHFKVLHFGSPACANPIIGSLIMIHFEHPIYGVKLDLESSAHLPLNETKDFTPDDVVQTFSGPIPAGLLKFHFTLRQ